MPILIAVQKVNEAKEIKRFSCCLFDLDYFPSFGVLMFALLRVNHIGYVSCKEHLARHLNLI